MNEDGSGAFKCPNCSKTTSGYEKFCIDCGQALDIVCPDCGQKWRFMFDVSFCQGCGHNMKQAGATKTKQSDHIS